MQAHSLESTTRSSLRKPVPSTSSYTDSPAPIPSTPPAQLTSYFDISHPDSQASRNSAPSGYTPYQPRQSRSYASSAERTSSSGRSIGPRFWTRSPFSARGYDGLQASHQGASPLENWQGLHDLVTEPEEEDDDDATTILGDDGTRTPRIQTRSSVRSLRSILSQTPRIPLNIPKSSGDIESRGASGVLSTSPGQIDSGIDTPSQPFTIAEDPAEDEIDERGDAVQKYDGSASPLLPTGDHAASGSASGQIPLDEPSKQD